MGHTLDRIGRGTIYVEACCMSMYGGIQPGRLRSYLVEALADGPSNDGLIQRFQLLVWPDEPRDWKLVDRPPDRAAQEEAAELFQRLLELPPFIADSPPFRFEPEAQSLFNQWFTDLELSLRRDGLHPALQAHFSKYRSLMPTLALVFHLADCNGDYEGRSVSLQHAQQAAAFCAYLSSHAQRVYSCISTPQLRAARDLARKIRSRSIRLNGGMFTTREVYLKGWTGLNTKESVKAAVGVLIDAGWIRKAVRQAGQNGGRPSDRYEVNPRVWDLADGCS